MNEKIQIIDTTLRDGEQRPRIAMKVADKIKIAEILDKCGVYEIEAGTPSVGIEGDDYYIELREKVKFSKISIWSRMVSADIKKAILCKPDIIHIGVPISYVQIYSKLRKNKVWVHRNIKECMEMILGENISVTIGFEDASRADEGFMLETAKLIKEKGGKTIRIADTVGVLTPSRTYSIIRSLSERAEIDIEFHGHNDLGMVLANSIVGVKAGAKYVDCTLLGIGERSGNCDFRKFLEATERVFANQINKKMISFAEETLKEVLYKRKR
jgi:homocitrate synthase NifV